MGSDWLPVRRFGVLQKDKLRPIDDFKENQVNKTFASSEKLELRTMDHTLWSLFTILKLLLYDGRLDFTLSSVFERIFHGPQMVAHCLAQIIMIQSNSSAEMNMQFPQASVSSLCRPRSFATSFINLDLSFRRFRQRLFTRHLQHGLFPFLLTGGG